MKIVTYMFVAAALGLGAHILLVDMGGAPVWVGWMTGIIIGLALGLVA